MEGNNTCLSHTHGPDKLLDIFCPCSFWNMASWLLTHFPGPLSLTPLSSLLNHLSNYLGLTWCQSHLTNRTVCYHNWLQFPPPAPARQGGPQGSVLGPILFTINTLHLGQIIQHYELNFRSYADDSQLCLSIATFTSQNRAYACGTCGAAQGSLGLSSFRSMAAPPPTSAEFCNQGIILDSILPSQSQSKSATKLASSSPLSASTRTPAIAPCSEVCPELRVLPHTKLWQHITPLSSTFYGSPWDSVSSAFSVVVPTLWRFFL